MKIVVAVYSKAYLTPEEQVKLLDETLKQMKIVGSS